MGEQQYLDLLKKVLEHGTEKPDRTGTGTYSLFGEKMEFDISEKIPILTTKKVFWKSVLIELLWFLAGKTDVETLQRQGVKIWNGNSSREFLDKTGLHHLREGDLGEVYGFQWRHFGAEYKTCDDDYKGQGFDQIAEIVRLLKEDPFSRRIILSAWNPPKLRNMCLPPCHCLSQFNVTEKNGVRYLDCLLYQRSGDLFLGVPFNIASYSFLTYMLAQIADLKPRKFVHVIGDAHIYKNHVDAVNKQLVRVPKEFPTLRFARDVQDIDDFKVDDFVIENYECEPYISAPMAV